MREWDVVIEGDGPLLDDCWAAMLASVLVPYDGVVTVQDHRATAALTIRADDASRVARLVLSLWWAVRPSVRFTSLRIGQLHGRSVPAGVQRSGSR
jgi:hypothetical protein